MSPNQRKMGRTSPANQTFQSKVALEKRASVGTIGTTSSKKPLPFNVIRYIGSELKRLNEINKAAAERQRKRDALEKKISGHRMHEGSLTVTDIQKLLAEEVGKMMKGE